MIKCTNELCETQWFHSECIVLPDSVDENNWFCENCLEAISIEEAVCQYDNYF